MSEITLGGWVVIGLAWMLGAFGGGAALAAALVRVSLDDALRDEIAGR